MKKLLFLLSLILTLITALSFSACTPLHRDLFGDYQYDTVYHWQPFIKCSWGIHDIEPAKEFHVDKDGDNLCDVCPCPIKHEHIVDDWYIEEEHHYKQTVCTWHSCDIDCPLLPHIDTDSNGLCDDCGYDLQTTDNGQ